MKKSFRITGTFSMVAALCSISILIGARPARLAGLPSQQSDRPPTKGQNLKIQKLTGDAARLRAKQLRKRNKGVARAMKDAEKKGLREAFDQGIVVLATDPAKTALRNSSRDAASIVKTSFCSFAFRILLTASTKYPSSPMMTAIRILWEGIIYRNGPDIDEATHATQWLTWRQKTIPSSKKAITPRTVVIHVTQAMARVAITKSPTAVLLQQISAPQTGRYLQACATGFRQR